jgi:GNAT superfamily N-acetyltransferase
MDIEIRKATREDATSIADLLRSLGYFAHLEAEPAATTEQRVDRHLSLSLADDSHLMLVAQNPGGEILGYVAVHWLPYLFLPGPEGYVSELFVREVARSRGLGGRLLEEVKAEARRCGCWRLMLVNMRQRESYQRGFYAKKGWQERPAAANFVFNFDEDG